MVIQIERFFTNLSLQMKILKILRRIHCIFTQPFVNGAADFTSVVETHKPLGGHDGCKNLPLHSQDVS